MHSNIYFSIPTTDSQCADVNVVSLSRKAQLRTCVRALILTKPNISNLNNVQRNFIISICFCFSLV